MISVGMINFAFLNPPIGLARYMRKVIRILSKDIDITAYCFKGEERFDTCDIDVRFVDWNLFKLFGMRRHDVIITTGTIESYMAFIVKLFKPSLKIIAETHHIPGKNRGFTNSLLNLFGEFLMDKFDAVITVSDFWKRKISRKYKISKNKIYVATVGIEDVKMKDKIKFKLDLSHPIIYDGITSPEHNLELIVKSMPLIKKKLGNATLLLTGRKDERYFEKIMAMSRYYDIDVIHLGVLSEENLSDVYRQIDIVAYVPTEEIGWSAVLLKGILYKKPSIASNRGALKELVNRYDGIIVKNNVKSFSDAVIKLVKNKKLKNKIIKNAHDKAVRDTWFNTAKIHLDCIKEVIK